MKTRKEIAEVGFETNEVPSPYMSMPARYNTVASAAPVGGVRVTVNGHPGPRLPLALLADHVDVSLGTPTTARRLDGSESTDPHGGTSARLLPVPGKKAGDRTEFDDPRMANTIIR